MSAEAIRWNGCLTGSRNSLEPSPCLAALRFRSTAKRPRGCMYAASSTRPGGSSSGECAGNILRNPNMGTYAQGSGSSVRAPCFHSAPTVRESSTQITRCKERNGCSINVGHSGGIGDSSSENARTACVTHVHGSTAPSQRYGGCKRRRSRPSLATSRSRCHAASDARNERLMGSSSTSSHAGMIGVSHAAPECVNGHAHVPVTSSQLPWRVHPAGQPPPSALPLPSRGPRLNPGKLAAGADGGGSCATSSDDEATLSAGEPASTLSAGEPATGADSIV